MASGVEIAGLVLGALPVLLAGLRFYAEGIAVGTRMWKYKEGVKRLSMELQTEIILYENSINILLVGVVSQVDMPMFLTSPGGALWKEKSFQQNLERRLGTSYVVYLEVISQLQVAAQEFHRRLGLNEAGNAQFSKPSTLRENYKRLRFSLQVANYKDLMTTIRQANLSLHRLTTQRRELEDRLHTPKRQRQSLPNFEIIQERAQSLASVLRTSWNCACQVQHGVSLRLEARMDETSDEADTQEEGPMQEPFRVLFQSNLQRVVGSGAGVKTTLWAWEEADVQVTGQRSKPIGGVLASNEATVKNVRFATSEKKVVKAVLNCRSETRSINDLCSAISTLQGLQRDVCLQLTEDKSAKQDHGVLIYPMITLPSDTEHWFVSTLDEVIRKGFARRDRLHLAVTLASSVLQLHCTPWLGNDWGTKSIQFIERPGVNHYRQPFVAWRSDQPLSSPSKAVPSILTAIVKNEALFALGVALIELWYGQTLDDLHKPEDGVQHSTDAQTAFITRFTTADRLADDLASEAGGKYSDAVRRCIRCNFHTRASSLADVQFQNAVYRDVVAQLKINHDFLFEDEEP